MYKRQVEYLVEHLQDGVLIALGGDLCLLVDIEKDAFRVDFSQAALYITLELDIVGDLLRE